MKKSLSILAKLTATSLLGAVMLAMSSSPAHALCSSPDEQTPLDGLGIANFAVFTLGSPTDLNITGPSGVFGAIGMASNGKFDITGPSVVNGGDVYLGTGVSQNVTSHTKPTVVTGEDFSALVLQVLDPNTGLAAAALSVPQNIFIPGGALKSGLTICDHNYGSFCDVFPLVSMENSCNAIDLTGIQLNGANVFLYSESPNASFTINVSGPFALNGGSQIVPLRSPSLKKNVLSAGDILFNVTGSSQPVSLNGGAAHGIGAPCPAGNFVAKSQLEGILFAPYRDVQLDPGLVCGEVISGGSHIAITSGGEVINAESQGPQQPGDNGGV